EQKLAEEALREREQQLRAILDNAPVGLFLKDRDRRYLLVNRQYADWRGFAPEAMVGRTDAELAPDVDAISRGPDAQVLTHGRVSRIERRPMTPYPGLEYFEVVKFPIADRDGAIVGLSGFVFDVTERRRIEDQLRQSAKMEAVGRLASGIAHDFNNMIGAITGFSSFLIEDLPSGTPQHQFAARIAQVCGHAKDVVKQVTAFSGTGEVETRLVDLRSLVAKDEPLVRASLAPATRLTVDPGTTSLPMIVNDGQIHQVLLNLCVNANDALGGRPGTITARLERIGAGHPDRRHFAVSAREAGVATMAGGALDPARAYGSIRITDTGVGMDQATLDRVFEPFFTTKGPSRGTGLGLAVIHGIVIGYQGAYRVTSRAGHGSEFTIYLPLVAETIDAAPVPRIGDAQRGSESILVIDDDRDMTELMSVGLERLGYDVTCSNNPTEALRAFRKDPGAWDAVVTDHSMPGMLGATLAKRIKVIRPDCPVVLYSGGADLAVLGPRAAPDADRVLLKPIEPRRVAEHIRGLLDRSRTSIACVDD
ncbi:MAG: PAS domain-containing protein, partial [Proteobacteria bacterium]|nr:PAS domain-containing protein [Pseudomonadota bacterium]